MLNATAALNPLGQLVISDTSDCSDFSVSGSIGAGASDVIVSSGVQLTGSGQIATNTIVESGATLNPGQNPGDSGQFIVDSLEMAPNSLLQIDISGSLPGVTHDQIAINTADATDGSVDIDGALLEVSFIGTASSLPATEFVVLANDGSDNINGRFSTFQATDGTTLSTARVLNEGDLLFASGAGVDRDIFLSYAGGDGNDVSLFTTGQFGLQSQGVTLIERVGANLEFRQGTTLANAQAASRLIRSASSLSAINISGTAGDDLVQVDLHNWFDANNSVDTINFVGDEFSGDVDQLQLIDSVGDTQIDSVTYTIGSAEAGTLLVTESSSDGPSLQIRFSEIESVQQDIVAANVTANFSSSNDDVSINAIGSSVGEVNMLQIESDGQSGSEITFRNPADSLRLNGGGGNDGFVLDGFAAGFDAELLIDGESGADQILQTTDLVGIRDVNFIAEQITINGDIISSPNTDVTLSSGGSVLVASGSEIRTGLGSILVEAVDQVVTTGSLLQSESDDTAVTIRGANSVAVGDLIAISGTVAIGENTSTVGSISQSAGDRVVADRLVIHSVSTVDLVSADNEIQFIDTLRATGDVQLVNSTDEIQLSNVVADGSLGLTTDGSIFISEPGIDVANTVELFAGDSINAIAGTTNHISANQINLQATSGDIGLNEPIDVNAQVIVNAQTQASERTINIVSDRVLPLGIIQAIGGNVTLKGLQIEDASDDGVIGIQADRIQLDAENGIGNGGSVELDSVQELFAATDSGGISIDSFVTETSTVSLTADSGEIRFTQSGQQLLEIANAANASGDIRIANQDGSVNVLGGPENTIDVGGSGAIQVSALGTDSSIDIQGIVQSDLGDVELLADGSLTFAATANVNSTDGSVRLLADQDADQQGLIAMQDGAQVDSGLGSIELLAHQDITLSSIRSASTGDAIVVRSLAGQIVDNGDTLIDIEANLGQVTLSSVLGIGDSNALETSIGSLLANVSDTGTIELIETDDLVLSQLLTNDGRIEVSAGGTITADQVISNNASSLDEPMAVGEDTRDIQLITNGIQSDILVGEITALGGADVFLFAGDDIRDTDVDDTNRLRADDLFLDAGNGTADGANAIELTTEINDLQATVSGTSRGDLVINEIDSLTLASSDTGSDSDSIVTSNGEIRIRAAGDLRIADPDVSNEGLDRQADIELLAGGDNGRINLFSTNEIEFADGVVLSAAQSSAGAVTLDAADITLGETIEINTGDGIGIARVFSPRPDFELTDTAFFDATTVSTNILEQAAINDATGILTLEIGNEGERGLSINIDWGGRVDRFQQIDGLSGDAPPVNIAHTYLEADILDSQLNSRNAATDPIEVRFSVRHHESILVNGLTVTQGDGETEQIEGELVSSTDNPFTQESGTAATLENGEASFIIPALSIPVAFFPVRDVIPETEEPVTFTRSEVTVVVSQSSFETSEASATQSTTREEYFQIRVLSPDPNGDDLAEPTRLPDDILDGNKLGKLFSSLPDGQYEIEYVLGDGNERSILKVDLRDGKPTAPIEDLDGGQLRLRLLDSNDSTREDTGENESASAPSPQDASVLEQTIESNLVSERARLAFESQPRLSAANRMLARLARLN